LGFSSSGTRLVPLALHDKAKQHEGTILTGIAEPVTLPRTFNHRQGGRPPNGGLSEDIPIGVRVMSSVRSLVNEKPHGEDQPTEGH
jgi:hypothetical protein